MNTVKIMSFNNRIKKKQSRVRLFVFLTYATIFLSVLGVQVLKAQGVGISESSITPDPSAVLEVRSSQRGFLPPRLTTGERDAIVSPANGLMVFNTTTGRYNVYDGDTWLPLSIQRDLNQLTTNFTTASTTLIDVTGLADFSLEANSVYYFKFKCLVTTSVGTVGILLSINSSSPVTSINYIQMYPTSATAITYEQVIALQGGTLPLNGPGGTPREYTLEGTIATSSAVTIALRARSETGGNVIVRAGSFGWFKKL